MLKFSVFQPNLRWHILSQIPFGGTSVIDWALQFLVNYWHDLSVDVHILNDGIMAINLHNPLFIFVLTIEV